MEACTRGRQLEWRGTRIVAPTPHAAGKRQVHVAAHAPRGRHVYGAVCCVHARAARPYSVVAVTWRSRGEKSEPV